MATYVLTLFGAINVIYYRDLALYLVVTEVHGWTVADPYVGPDTLSRPWRATAAFLESTTHLTLGDADATVAAISVRWIEIHLEFGDFTYQERVGYFAVTQVAGIVFRILCGPVWLHGQRERERPEAGPDRDRAQPQESFWDPLFVAMVIR